MQVLDQKDYFEVDAQIQTQVEELYQSAFPSQERMPFEMLLQIANRPSVSLNIYFKDTEFIGFVFTMFYEDILSIQYLAIVNNQRNSGFGTQIIGSLKKKNVGLRLVVEMEKVDPKSADYQNQLKRLAFYERNGFQSNQIFIYEYGVDYELLTYGSNPVTTDEYVKLAADFYQRDVSGFMKEIK
ncbi:MAG: GNAT family N-acetyltransferase [Lactobacillaceae bacterium]|jgi:hypothetical protein|nr:GNAT family N-acetyltransferase [Lactobacillaceae bacterium]